MIVYSWAGLCNRLRVLFSYHFLNKNEKMVIIWENNRACPGLFLDYFEPIKNVDFLNEPVENIDVKANGQHKKTRKDFIYEELKLKNYLKEKINQKIEELGNYVAVHIRRTDTISTPWKKESYVSDEDYIKFINDHPDHNVYIATDNYETQKKFYDLFKDKVKVINFIEKPKKYIPAVRQTSLEDTIIDIYMCIGADHFMGSGYSSMTTLIEQIRDHNQKTQNLC